MKKLYEKSETGCCLRFDPKPWDKKVVIFKDKLFIKDTVNCFFHIPLNFGKAMVRNMEKIKEADALAVKPILLCDNTSLWSTDIYIAVKKKVPNANMVKISGKFMSKVYEGSFNNIGKWIKDMKEYVKSEGIQLKKLYLFYTTCPKCAKFYGKNYVVILAKI